MRTVDVTPFYSICEDFARRQLADGITRRIYAKRKQKNETVIKKQILVGKLGEFGVYLFLKDAGLNVTPPDLTITKDKSFSADLYCSGKRVHVKTCEFVPKRSVSWVFQREDPLTYKPDPEDYVALCLYFQQEECHFIKIMRIVKATYLVECNLFESMRLKRLNASKTAVYYRSLIESVK